MRGRVAKARSPDVPARVFSLGVDPSNRVFLDDMQVNVDGSIAVGMRGILVSDREVAISDVLRLAG